MATSGLLGGLSDEEPKSGWAGFLDLLRSFPGQVRLALGIRGVMWATAAGIIGVGCCLIAFADIALSLHRSDVDPERRRARDVRELDLFSRDLMRTILANAAANPGPARVRASGEPWHSFVASLDKLCGEFETPPQTRLGMTCRAKPEFVARVGAEIARFDETRQPLRPAIVRELLEIRDDISDLSQVTTRTADAMIGRLVEDYTQALLVLTLCTSGFAAAGLMLILLVGRASVDYHAQWRRAVESAHAAGASRDMLSEIIEALPAGVVVYDQNERLMMFNSVAQSLTPALREPGVIGRSYEDLAHDTARRLEASGRGPQPVQQWIDRFRQKNTEHARQSQDGRWFDWSEKGTKGGLTVGLRVEVTDLKQQEIALEQARVEYQSLVDSLADVAYTLDVETGRFIFMSAAAKEFFGVPPHKIVGNHFLQYIAPESHDQVRNTTTRNYDPDDQGTFARFSMIGAGGQVRRVEVRARRRIDANGRLISTGVIRDVEEQVQLEARLDEEMTRLQSIVGSGGALIVLVDADLKVQMVNLGFTQFTGITEADAVGRSLQDVVPVALNPARTKRSRFAVKLLNREGRERLVALTATPLLTDGGVSSIVLLGVDDTERREAEQALASAERFATVGEMASTMAHEISQPLQVINIACASAVESLDDPDYVKEKLERIASQVDTASRIIGDLRAYVHGSSSDRPMPFDANDAVRAAIDLTDHGVSEAGMEFNEQLSTGLPQVMGEMARLEQVLVNLINNARDAGGPSISIMTETVEQNDRRWVRVLVEDRGPGIAAEVLPKLFQSFVSTKPKGKGTGLGLRICRRIIEEMGGSISAANRDDGGARFEILLPAIAKN
ncbi:MAG TPA: PAS domain S-box protein [Reyranella sp.]|nr:PAS domain S-box protein [Reyranella sp.]